MGESHPFHGYKMWDEETYEVLITPAIVACPEAVMIRDFSTSAGEQTATCQLASHSTMTMGQIIYALVAIVPYTSASFPNPNLEKRGTYGSDGSYEM
jgi:hypothetical protein